MYLEHFNFKEFPFSLTPNVDFYCNLSGHQNTLNVVLLALRTGEGFVKVIGEVGSGKTLLCRMLLEQLGRDVVTAYIPNPDLTPDGLRIALGQELGLKEPFPTSQHALLDLINNRLLALHDAGKQVVLIIDEAQAMSDQSLEALRLLTNLETCKAKLLQVVLFGQPELDVRLNQNHLRQLNQRITFACYLPRLNREELEAYLCHRLATAGHTLGSLFTRRACSLLYRKSQGIPRLINILCHKALMAAYGRGEQKVQYKSMSRAIVDTGSLHNKKKSAWLIILVSMLLLAICLVGIKCYTLWLLK